MEHFAGLDVSVKLTSLCIVDDAGRIIREAKVESDPDALVQVLKNGAYHFKRIGLEAGPLSQWLFSALAEAGLPVICVETRHMRAALKARINKTDRNDARGMAQMMRAGLYRPVHVKTVRSQKLRRRTLREQFGVVHRRLLAVVRQDEVCRRLMSVPGVGPVVALTYRSTVDVPARFRNSKAVGAVFGLTPSRYQSGEIDRTGAISRCGDEMMRVMLYEAAQSMLYSRRWSWLKAWAMQIARRRGIKKAIVALARRLAVVMHRIWVDGTEFRWTRQEAAAA
jgi:transposase